MDWEAAEDCVTNPPATESSAAVRTWTAERSSQILALLEADPPRAINSPYNPERLLNNCVFVTLAYLLHTNARDLCDRIGIRPVPGSPGVTLEAAVTAIERLGIRFCVVRFSPSHPPNPLNPRNPLVMRPNLRQNVLPPPRDGIPESYVTWRQWPRRVGVAYTRANGTGHVVVCNSPGAPYRRYMDYQTRADGQDVTREVQQSRVFMVFAVDWQRSRGSFIEALQRQEAQEEQAQRQREEEQKRQEEEQKRQAEEKKQRDKHGFYGGRFYDKL
ncbi:hypothetical protein SERLA73DRAFT_181667 [Serpula lacrymans var. lacrymans S7.3]|uniref:Uncharacterized protein n=2 Tax=Serpula lacrymans var. lacrymans TaxID=341189 RepID=F8PYH2_SERL3|nr:uncharacterized protein SERLADRAFT_467977 [Serpula lacrymans var. lacrymans S7.9]EGN98935.1 hypothetical protein SERLA73DRAFT_181667 [Serpula lacrymans var. lacrymans S7.3]EGO24524.1 hypothetical protein SERLADRAFT_467977 [Serpula lacrymans var. lacrymans S7.9]